MKKLFYIFFIVLCLLAACSRNDNSLKAVLMELDSLTLVNPDSSRKQLIHLEPSVRKASESEQMYYALLRIKVDDKLRLPSTTDTIILQIADYYEQHEEEGRLPEAYYYVGRKNSDLQNGEKAILYYQKALFCDTLHISTYLKSRIYAQLGYIYLRNGLYDEAMSMQHLAHFYCEQMGDTLGMRYSSEDIATIEKLSDKHPTDTIARREMTLRVQKIYEQYKNQELVRKNNELSSDSDTNRQLTFFVSISAFLAVVGLLGAFIYFRRKSAQRKDSMTAEMPKRHFYDADIADLLSTHIHGAKVLKPADWIFIEERLLSAFPDFKNSLYSVYDFSETEYRICMLIKLEVSPSNMAKLMAASNSTISQSRLRMQQKVFNGKGSAKDWDRFVLSL